RYVGLAGAVLLAVAAHLGGALPELRLKVTPVTVALGEHGPLILASWLLGVAALTWAWWSARDALAGGAEPGSRPVPSARWVWVTAGLWLVPLLVSPPLGSRDVYSYACQGRVFADGGNPYRYGVAELGCPWLDSVTPMWRDTPAPYGPGFVLLAGAAAVLGGTLWGTVALLRALAVRGVLVTALCLPALARRCGVPEERALWLVLACPVVAVHLVSGAHNDALMVGLLVAGLAVAATAGDGASTGPPGPAPDRPLSGVRRSWLLLAAGLLLGLAVSVKVTAAVVVPFAALVAAGRPYRTRALLRDGGQVAAGAAVGLLATTLAAGLGFGWVAGLGRSGDSVQWTAPPTALGYLVEYLGRLFGLHLDAVPVTRAVALALLPVVLAVLWWRARHDGALFGAGLALVATVLLAPVFHPWYATWPLAVLAATAPRTRWFVVPVMVVTFLTLPDGTSLARFSKVPGTILMTSLLVWALVRWRRSRQATPTVTPA
ncbi:MAG TPA: polyprenol phosphomannose-dependent alpha 1,6 mannosyltransferase MptB, partial [Micromonospora sp.]